MSAPDPFLGARGLSRLLNRGVNHLAFARGVRMPGDFPPAFLVAEAITDLE
jgi:hypothetical protein